MRLGDALLLGSTLLKPKPYCINDGEGSGCAIGMLQAVGHYWKVIFPLEVYNNPCGCPNGSVAGMVHVFNEHVCGDHTWTIEMLADWLNAEEARQEAIWEQKAQQIPSVPVEVEAT